MIQALLFATACLSANAMHLYQDKDSEGIKPVKVEGHEDVMGLNLMKQKAHQSLADLKRVGPMKPFADKAEGALNLVEYKSKKAMDALKYENVKSKAEKAKYAVDYQVKNAKNAVEYQAKNAKNAVEYQVNHTLVPLQKEGKEQFMQLQHTVQVLSHKAMVDAHMVKLKTYTYKDFVKEHPRSWKEGSPEWKTHEEAFNKKYAMITAHNTALPDNSWATGINKFMDYTDEEYNRMMGYKGNKEKSTVSSLLEVDEEEIMKEIPEAFAWSAKLKKSSFHRDQGACGSCWAVAAAQVVEDHLALKYNETYQLSMQHIVSCTPNPEKCGGTGGCQGATSELAFKYIQEHGIAADVHWPYTSGFTGQNGKCANHLVEQKKFVSIGSYVVLPENKQAPLLQALYEQGPLVVSVAASNWQMYSFGVFAGCSKDAVINHAVVAEGFGQQMSDLDHKMHKYFLIKNSWGDDWGEDGYMKIKRFDSETEHCGIDNKPEDGTGCENGPPQVKVCGMCGILYDSAYPLNPEFVGKEKGGVYVKGSPPKALPKKIKSLKGSNDLPLR